MKLAYLEIDYQRGAYDAMDSVMRASFFERLGRSWLYHECALEGIVLEPREIERALGARPCRTAVERKRDALMRRMHRLWSEIVQGRVGGEPMSLEWLKETHAALCDGDDPVAGRYRKRDTSPGVYHLDVPNASSISYQFRRAIDTYESELSAYHPVRAAALAHWEFMRVFPFDERSGLVGRLLANALLVRGGYPPAVIHSGKRHHYFGALSGSRSEMVAVVAEACAATVRAANAFSDGWAAPAPAHAAL